MQWVVTVLTDLRGASYENNMTRWWGKSSDGGRGRNGNWHGRRAFLESLRRERLFIEVSRRCFYDILVEMETGSEHAMGLIHIGTCFR